MRDYYVVVVKHGSEIDSHYDIDFVSFPKKYGNKANERSEILNTYYAKQEMICAWCGWLANNFISYLLKKDSAERVYDNLAMGMFTQNHNNNILSRYDDIRLISSRKLIKF